MMNTDPMSMSLVEFLTHYMAAFQPPHHAPLPPGGHNHPLDMNRDSVPAHTYSAASAEEWNKMANEVQAEAIGKQYLMKALNPLSVEDALAPIPHRLPLLPLQALTPRQATQHYKHKERYFIHKARLLQSELIKFDDDFVGRKQTIIKFGQDYLNSLFGPEYSGGWGFQLTPSSIYGPGGAYPGGFYDATKRGRSFTTGSRRAEMAEHDQGKYGWGSRKRDGLEQYDEYDDLYGYGDDYDDDYQTYGFDAYNANKDFAALYGKSAGQSRRGPQSKAVPSASGKRGKKNQGGKKRNKAKRGKIGTSVAAPKQNVFNGKAKAEDNDKAGEILTPKSTKPAVDSEIKKPLMAESNSSNATDEPSFAFNKPNPSKQHSSAAKNQPTPRLSQNVKTSGVKNEPSMSGDKSSSLGTNVGVQAGKEIKYQMVVYRKPFRPSKRPERDCWNGRVYL